MSISYQVLGKASGDNALIVHIDTGQSIEHLLFDCGEGCLKRVPTGIVQKIDHLFFSHLHMDHIGGFDSFFRANYNRSSKPNHVWGPPETTTILQHRFQGYMWNLHEKMSSTWLVTDIYPEHNETFRYELKEAFSVAHEFDTSLNHNILLETENYTIESITLNHLTPSLAYLIREKPHFNIDTDRMATLGLSPGPWLKQLKESGPLSENVTDSTTGFTRDELKKQLLIETPGDSLAYITDFLPDGLTMERLSSFLSNCSIMVCEAQYRSSDIELARKNFHSTSSLSAQIAKEANVGKLILFHISDRYRRKEWLEILNEARGIFPDTCLPVEWNIKEEL